MNQASQKDAYLKIWKQMFSSYLVIIFISFLVYTVFVFWQSVTTMREIRDRQGQLYANSAISLLDDRILSAKSLAIGINSSANLKKLYYSQFTGTGLTTYERYQLRAELRSERAAAMRLDLIQAAVFINGKTDVYTTGEYTQLSTPFLDRDEAGRVYFGSIAAALGLDAQDQGTFSGSGFVYSMPYTHSGQGANGRIAVLYDLEGLIRNIHAAIGVEYGARLVLGGQAVYQSGTAEGLVYTADSAALPALTLELYLPAGDTGAAILLRALPLLGAAGVLGLLFLLMSYYLSKKYYAPLGKIGRLLGPAQQQPQAESLVSGVESLLGQRDDYRKKIDSISPYAEQRILRQFLLGNGGPELLQSLAAPPVAPQGYYSVAAVNAAWAGGSPARPEEREPLLQACLGALCEALGRQPAFANATLYRYISDEYLAFLIVNAARPCPADAYYKVQAWLDAHPADTGCRFTLGVSVPRQGGAAMADACRSAVKAASDGVLMCGRGEVYFEESPDDPGARANYYFPADLDVAISHCLRHQEPEKLAAMLHSIYEKNVLRPNIDAETLRILVDQLHLAVMKGLRAACGAEAPAVLPRAADNTPLDEIFAYYEQILQARMEAMAAHANAEPAQQLFDELEAHLFDPNLSLKGMAERFGWSEKYVLQLCRKKYGMTFLQYLQARRIERARTLLANPALTIAQVAAQCGYTSDQSFRRNFVTQTSVTPAEYRENLKSSK